MTIHVENFIRPMTEPEAIATVIAANVPWNAINTNVG